MTSAWIHTAIVMLVMLGLQIGTTVTYLDVYAIVGAFILMVCGRVVPAYIRQRRMRAPV